MISAETLAKYTGYFHDGSLIDIKTTGNNIALSMRSAEVDSDDIEDRIPLSCLYNMFNISGKLHLNGVKKILIDNKESSSQLTMQGDMGDIFDFEIEGNKVILHIIWNNYRPMENAGCSDIEIEADTICWQSIPELKNPFW